MSLERLVVPIEWKATDDAQILEGYASTFGNVDLGGDVVVKGAFKKTIANIKANGIPLLADHVPSVNSVLGTIYDAVEDDKGLKIWAKFSSAQSAQDARTKLVEGHVNKMSIGYEAIGQKPGDQDGQRVRFLTEVKLWETSVVVFPMNPEAVINRVKAIMQAADIDAEYERLVAAAKALKPADYGGDPEAGPETKATANEAREALQTALSEHHRGTSEYAYLRDFDDTKVWYELYGGGSKGSLFERTYELDDDKGLVTLGGESTKVRAVVTYVPIEESDDSKGITLRLGETKSSEGDEPPVSGDDPDDKAADPAAPASDEPAVVPDEGAKGWDRYGSEALLAGRDPDAIADSAKRAGLEQQLDLMEIDVNRSRELLSTSALQLSAPTDKE